MNESEERTTQPTILKNVTCPYCGVELDDTNRTKDHVVARRFVPKRKMEGCWNLILFACRVCNNYKSTIENDLSAISMQPNLVGERQSTDHEAIADARRKAARGISLRTGKPVAASEETIEIAGSLGPSGRYTATFTSPPQAEDSRVYALARLHFLAFFYRLTFNDTARKGYMPMGVFLPVNVTVRSDWGSSLQVGFMHQTSQWWTRLVAVTADGYFRVAIRKHPDLPVWSCALEWNANLRVIALVGEETVVRTMASELPPLKLEVLGYHDQGVWRGRAEVSLDDNQDEMFADGSPEPSARPILAV